LFLIRKQPVSAVTGGRLRWSGAVFLWVVSRGVV
jgi:hypothetical protein